ncbi:MAG: helix-turn-helix domain-containing protein [Burkholderiales bacterium]|nr:helix-turn-helix domain-containing protein [Burkholderiales bacterium]
MDSALSAAARLLAADDALAALKHVALRDDPPALALRGIAMAQLGEHARARDLLRRAARGFGGHEAASRARCIVADAEVALALREFGGSAPELAQAATTLDAHGDHVNALRARLIATRRALLLGRLDEAAATLPKIDSRGVPPAVTAVAEMAAAELALRSLRGGQARAAFGRAHAAAYRCGVPALIAELAQARAALDRPAARLLASGEERALRLDEVEALHASGALLVDACRRGLGAEANWVPLARRPILFALAFALARAWPNDVDRNGLIAFAFRTRAPDATHRARLRVEIGRLRALVKGLARVEATPRGFVLEPRDAVDVVVIAPPFDGEDASLVALLSDGCAWSTSALAMALGASQRAVQRALAELEAANRVRSIGKARARRWLAPSPAGFTTILLLPTVPPIA